MESTSAPLAHRVRPDLLRMAGYEPVEPVDEIAARHGIPPEQIAKLDGNENAYGPCPAALQAVRRATLELYSDPDQRRLREALSGYTGVASELIVAGHGSDEIIDLVGRALLSPGDNVVECTPTFGMYRFTAALCAAEVRAVARREDFSLDLEGMRAVIDAGTKIIFLPSPNNPSGNLLSRSELETCLAMGPAVVIDEAYIEFAGFEHSVADLLPRHDNLIVLRTFSKWAALAGLRLGYGLMPGGFADLLRVIKPPYTPNVAAEAAGIASLTERDWLMAHVHAIVAERERLIGELAELGYLEPMPSRANFILCRVRRGDARHLRDRLRERGVFVRYFDQDAVRDCIRISVARRRDSNLLLAALRAIEMERPLGDHGRGATGEQR